MEQVYFKGEEKQTICTSRCKLWRKSEQRPSRQPSNNSVQSTIAEALQGKNGHTQKTRFAQLKNYSCTSCAIHNIFTTEKNMFDPEHMIFDTEYMIFGTEHIIFGTQSHIGL